MRQRFSTKLSQYLLFILLVIFFVTVFQNTARANICGPRTGWNGARMLMTFPTSLVVPAGKAVGDILYETELVITGTDIQIGDCPGPGTFYYSVYYDGVFNSMSPIQNVMKTNIPGIGIKLNARINITSGDLPLKSGVFNTPTGIWLRAQDRVKAYLIKTDSETGSGKLATGSLGRYQVAPDNTVVIYFLNNTPTNIRTSSCEIQGDKNKVIDFKNVMNKNLSSISGAVPGTQREVVIDLRCHPGSKVSVTFDSQYKDTILQSSLVNQGTAKGIYVHFPNIGLLGQSNTVINSSGEIETIRQTVELYRSGDFTSGSITTQATYTLNYE